MPRVQAAIHVNTPDCLAFNGKNAAQGALGQALDYGAQAERFGGARVFVFPSTSGAARRYWDIALWRELANVLTD